MKRLHLICNAHLDPLWMWDGDEGLASALSTFRSAVQLASEYDYIFCHNESLLYQWVEQYEPNVFAEIQRLVKEGKWHIMGGWYLQPDCHAPSGESFVRQIRKGQRYFEEKFGVKPTSAINFDSFGHSRGLVQILDKCGYDSYLFCRPMPNLKELPDDQFNWVGYDGSKIKCCRIGDDFMYTTDLAQAKTFIPKKAQCWLDHDTGVALWGVGNHGGGPSRIDLRDVNEMIQNSQDYEILHSTPEKFFSEVHPNCEVEEPLFCLVGCYSSMSSIKQKHIELENALYMTEKLCSVAKLNGADCWDEKAFAKAEEAMLYLEFHDTMGGTITSQGEKSMLAQAGGALYELSELRNKAFFSLIADEKWGPVGTYPLFVYNPSPYNREAVVEVELLILSAIASDTEQYTVTLKRDGKVVPCQVIKELSNINYDRRKRVVFKAELPATGTARFDLTVEITPKVTIPTYTGDIVFEDACKKVVIGKKTGLIESFMVDGKEYVSGGAFCPELYEDNADPWGWTFDVIGKNPVKAVLDDCKDGIFGGLENVHVIEDGDILTEVESFFCMGDSKLRLSYKLYRDLPYMDVHADVFWSEREKTLKLAIPTTVNGDFACQSAYGVDIFPQNGFEYPTHRFISMRDGDRAVSVFNNCIGATSAKDRTMYMTLMRGIAYCAHPIDDRQLIRDDRYIPFAEQGKHEFNFRFGVHDVAVTDTLAQEFCEPVYAVNAFPAGSGEKTYAQVRLSNQAVTLTAMYYEDGGYVVRMFNDNDTPQVCEVRIGDDSTTIQLGKYEIYTMRYEDGAFEKQDRMV